MKEKINVEVFYGEYDPENYFGTSFYFDNLEDAYKFIQFVKNHSDCNAMIMLNFNVSK